jgi:hypothetical protein
VSASDHRSAGQRGEAASETRSGWVVALGEADNPYYLTARGVVGTIATAGWFATREEAERAADLAGWPDRLVVSVSRAHGVTHPDM